MFLGVWFETDVSGLRNGPIFMGQDCPLNVGPIGSSKTSVLNPLTPRYNSEGGRILFCKRSYSSKFTFVAWAPEAELGVFEL
jgi:hypothetical protein